MEKVLIKVKKIHPNAKIPTRATEYSGGWDVYCTEVGPRANDFVICKTGLAMQPPPGYKITLVPRSSLTGTNWILQNSPGLGDPDYIGEYQFRFRAIPIGKGPYITDFMYSEFPYKPGDRIGQMYLEEIIPIQFQIVEELEETNRGSGGFGSTGK